MSGRLLVLGAEGQVARALAGSAPEASWDVATMGRARADLTCADLGALLDEARPDLVVNAAAYTAVDRAEEDEAAARALNADLPGRAARACADRAVPLVHISTDYVFDGNKGAPYVESDPLAPLGVYGRTKAEGEAQVLAFGGAATVLRTSWVFGAEGANFVHTMLKLAGERDEVAVVADQVGRPTWAGDVARACMEVGARLRGGDAAAGGILHAAGAEDATWADLAEAAFAESARLGGPSARVRRITTAEYPTPARRPADSRLESARLAEVVGWRPPSWRERLPGVVAALLRG